MNPNVFLKKVAFLGDYLPRKCGIATFTSDLRNAVVRQFPDLQSIVVAMSDRVEGYDYSDDVRFEILEPDLTSYRRAADFLNLSNADVLCVQHEFGIYGGKSGAHLLALLRAVRMPVVTTLHTILDHPSEEQRKVFLELLRLSTRLVVMTEKGAGFLKEIYGVPDSKIDVIPHGIPDVAFVDPNFYKEQFGVQGKQVILTFGLLSPNKGIETMLQALPEIVSEFPDVVYIILGATHPNLVRDQGEMYRLSLERLARKNGIERHVMFFNRFVELEELTEFIGVADIYVTPYLNEAQITSGTLAYSFGAGKAVVSTPYWHAKELLDHGRGMLVPFGDANALAQAINELLGNETRRHAMRRDAYMIGREMIWERVAERYGEVFEKARREHSVGMKRAVAAPTLDRQHWHLPPLKFDHLLRLTDSIGIFQHARYTIPDFNHGYCTDDNARALILMVMLDELEEQVPEGNWLTGAYAAFLQQAFHPENGRFRNFLSFKRTWMEDIGSEDSHGRALWALGTCVGRCRSQGLRAWAAEIFETAIGTVGSFTSPRAWAFAILGLHEYLHSLNGDLLAHRLGDTLVGRLMDCYRRTASDDWKWFEDVVSYDNAKLSHALILAGREGRRPDLLETGLDSLRWLVEHQKGNGGCFRPIGSNGFWQRGRPPAAFDQQPIEAHAMISACIDAYHATQEVSWLKEAQRAFDWFLGSNDLGLLLYDAQTGGCRDGLHMDRVNENQGAESTLAFLLSHTEMRRVQHTVMAFDSVEPAVS